MTKALSKKALNYIDPDLRIRIVKSYLYNGIETAAQMAKLEQSDIEVIVKAFEVWSDKREISDVLFESYYEYCCQPGEDEYIWFDETETDGYCKPPVVEGFAPEFGTDITQEVSHLDEDRIEAIIENVLDRYFVKAIGRR